MSDRIVRGRRQICESIDWRVGGRIASGKAFGFEFVTRDSHTHARRRVMPSPCHDISMKLQDMVRFLAHWQSDDLKDQQTASWTGGKTSAISESQPDAHHTAGFMTRRTTPDLTRSSHSVGLCVATVTGFQNMKRRTDRSLQSRSERAGRAFRLSFRSGWLFSCVCGFQLKLKAAVLGSTLLLFPAGIGCRRDLQGKSPGRTADRGLTGFLRLFCNAAVLHAVRIRTSAGDGVSLGLLSLDVCPQSRSSGELIDGATGEVAGLYREKFC